jgi:leucyl/phenylalanyl-tRNA--protein transferase
MPIGRESFPGMKTIRFYGGALIPASYCFQKRFILARACNRNSKKDDSGLAPMKRLGQLYVIAKPPGGVGQDSTWITPEVEHAYKNLHSLGYAHSAEAWLDDNLVGGLYGIRLGKVFFGESMFSHENNASKFAFISYVKQLKLEGVELIDCQVYTPHLETLGARMIPRKEFTAFLKRWID